MRCHRPTASSSPPVLLRRCSCSRPPSRGRPAASSCTRWPTTRALEGFGRLVNWGLEPCAFPASDPSHPPAQIGAGHAGGRACRRCKRRPSLANAWRGGRSAPAAGHRRRCLAARELWRRCRSTVTRENAPPASALSGVQLDRRPAAARRDQRALQRRCAAARRGARRSIAHAGAPGRGEGLAERATGPLGHAGGLPGAVLLQDHRLPDRLGRFGPAPRAAAPAAADILWWRHRRHGAARTAAHAPVRAASPAAPHSFLSMR